MNVVRTWLCAAAALLAVAGLAAAQTTNGTISGHVADRQGLALPGVTVSASSPNLQGERTVVTSENGDFVLPLLPPGTYTVSFDLSGFERVTQTVTLAPTQVLPLDARLGPAPITETVNVVGRAADVLTQTAQVATNFKQDLISTLPTTRDINAPLLIAPGVHPTGPGGNYSIAGAASFESLYLVNGVTVNENIRGQANNLYIEDAIQETTVATAGISAEYGRFSGGVVNVVTKSGGNMFSGSLRDTLYNDNWRALTTIPAGSPVPGNNAQTEASDTSYPGDVKFNHVVPTYEYTLGGPIVKDHLWFFTSGRLQDQIANRQTSVTNIPYTFSQNQKRYEANVTYSPTSNQRVYGAYTKVLLDQINGSQPYNFMDLASLYNASNPQDLMTLNYNGVLSSVFSVEGRVNVRHWASEGVGSPYTDLINGTMLVDRSRGGNTFRYWTSTFCGACDPEKRDNNDVFVKGNYFLSKRGTGSHSMVFGFDTFNDERRADNYQTGSNYRILGTSTIIEGTTIYPQFLDGSTFIQYNPLPFASLGTNFRTNSLFYNDDWRLNDNVTLNLGVRWDKNHGIDSAGHDVARDSAVSPRIGVVWDPTGEGKWTVTASAGKYVAALSNPIADMSSSAGNTSAYLWVYQGPQVNANPSAPLVGTAAAIQQVFNWCGLNANGFCTAGQLAGAALPGVSTTIPNGLESPHALEYSAGVSRQIADRLAVRSDFTFRDFRDFYSERIDTSTGTVADGLGNRFDVAVIENTNALKRRYAGQTTSLTYRVSARTDLGATYTLSRLWGNFDAENLNTGPIPADLFSYPEYRQQSWYAPMGDLSADQRHRAALWANYGVPKLDGFTLSALETLASGVPYGAVGQIDVRPYVNNPGYITPQGAPTENYYFTARDAFRTAGESRTDLAANYSHGISARSRHLDLFVQAQVINLFNQSQLCGCGGSVFVNGGNVATSTIGQSTLTNSTTPSLARFNPFTTVPVLGVNWNYGPNFGTAVSSGAYTSPRMFRLSFGIRF